MIFGTISFIFTLADGRIATCFISAIVTYHGNIEEVDVDKYIDHYKPIEHGKQYRSDMLLTTIYLLYYVSNTELTCC